MNNCYFWTETDGHKDNDEIGTCLVKYFMSLRPSVSKVHIFSDNCGEQNKNIQTVAVYLYAVNSIAHINETQYTFQETAHTHMECDGLCATIEHAKKYTKVHSVGQWEGILTTARRNSRCNVTRLPYSDFQPFLTNLLIRWAAS